ncbi:phosphodiester glycosidase family protein [Chachezhania sediminis]|uniref:phosphodiester glycosidase family protein n=1 Tax=Chachezhania sediminis TaxID=2599291 RepID=UPI001E474600|nr:phosphodiester glycosidase family protein [Chachezhania sediminis]
MTCTDTTFRNADYTICEVDPAQEELRLFLYDGTGQPFGQFSAIDAALAEQGKRLSFAMNAGMYHEDRAPVGHYVEDGAEIMRVIPGPGPGNFGMVPNGVFCIGEGTARVYETEDFLKRKPACRFATQSGPMLVIDGQLHPRFLPDSTSRHIRNGVGTSADGRRVVFAISRQLVNFHDFASLFRDELGLPDALYFDGNVSRLHAPAIGRSDPGWKLGPIVGTVAPLD